MNATDGAGLLSRVRSFMEIRVLLTAAELDLFTELRQAPATAEELAKRRNFDLRSLRLLLDALTALGLLEKSNAIYQPSPEARSSLDGESSESVLAMVQHQAHLWTSWSTLTARVDPGGVHSVRARATEAFIGAMHVIAREQASDIVAQVAPGHAHRLLDVGGASGSYTEAFLDTSPFLEATLFDRDEVVELARVRLEASPYRERIRFVGGDFLNDALPPGHDLAWLSAIIHSCSPAEVRQLFDNVAQALVPGGRIVIRDFVMEPDRTAPVGGTLFAINMLVNTAGGGTYTFEEIRQWLVDAGFERVRLIASTKTMNSMVEAYR